MNSQNAISPITLSIFLIIPPNKNLNISVEAKRLFSLLHRAIFRIMYVMRFFDLSLDLLNHDVVGLAFDINSNSTIVQLTNVDEFVKTPSWLTTI